jgi:hypothetical protein
MLIAILRTASLSNCANPKTNNALGPEPARSSVVADRLKRDPQPTTDIECLIPNAMNLHLGQLPRGVQGQGGEPRRNKEEARLRRQGDALLRVHPANVWQVVLQPIQVREPTKDKRIVEAGFKIDSRELIRPIQREQVDIAVRVARNKYVDHTQSLFESAGIVFQYGNHAVLRNGHAGLEQCDACRRRRGLSRRRRFWQADRRYIANARSVGPMTQKQMRDLFQSTPEWLFRLFRIFRGSR